MSAANKSTELSTFHWKIDVALNQCEVTILDRLHKNSGSAGACMLRWRYSDLSATKNSIRVENSRKVGKSASVSLRLHDRGKNIFHSYYAAYSSAQSTGIPHAARWHARLSEARRGKATIAVFPFADGIYSAANTPVCAVEWQPLFRYSPLDLQFRPSIDEIPAFPRNPRYFALFDLPDAIQPPGHPFFYHFAYLQEDYSFLRPCSRLPTVLPHTRVCSRLSAKLPATSTQARSCVIATLCPTNERRILPPSMFPSSLGFFLLAFLRPLFPRVQRFRIEHEQYCTRCIEFRLLALALAMLHFSRFSSLLAFRSFSVFLPCCSSASLFG